MADSLIFLVLLLGLIHSQTLVILLALVPMILYTVLIAYILTRCKRQFVILLGSNTALADLDWELVERVTPPHSVYNLPIHHQYSEMGCIVYQSREHAHTSAVSRSFLRHLLPNMLYPVRRKRITSPTPLTTFTCSLRNLFLNCIL